MRDTSQYSPTNLISEKMKNKIMSIRISIDGK